MKKKRKNRQLWTALAAVLCLMLLGSALFLGIRGQAVESMENPIRGISRDSSLKGWLGKGYAYTGQEQKAGKEQDTAQIPEDTLPEVEETPENPTEAQTEPDTEKETSLQTDSGDETETSSETPDTCQEEASAPQTVVYDDYSGEETETKPQGAEQNDDVSQDGAAMPGEEEPEEPVENRYPVVATDLTDGETVHAASRTFYVQATDYHGNVLPSSAISVHGNGQILYSAGTDASGIVTYVMNLVEGANTVEIRATDEEGWSTTLPACTIYRGEEDTPQPAGTVTISIEAGSVGLGTLVGATPVEFWQGEQLSSVLLRFLQDQGFDWRNSGSAESGFYLRSIGRSGLTSGAAIPDDLMAHLLEVNCQLTDHDSSWLGEFDFTMDSGWLYFVNGEYMNVGMASYFPADGDSVRLRFSLYAGADVGAGQNGETWGDW